MRVFSCRTIIVSGLCFLISSMAIAGDVPGAVMVYGKGSISLNGSPLPDSSAAFPNDLIETKPDGVATISAEGLNIIVQPDSAVKLGDGAITLDRGNVSVGTSKRLVIHASTATASAASEQWTEFEVTSINGTVEITARKSDVAVNCGKEDITLSQGEEVTADPSGKCGKRRKKAGAYPPAEGSILNSSYLKYIAAAAGGGVLIWVLLPKGHSPASPAIP